MPAACRRPKSGRSGGRNSPAATDGAMTVPVTAWSGHFALTCDANPLCRTQAAVLHRQTGVAAALVTPPSYRQRALPRGWRDPPERTVGRAMHQMTAPPIGRRCGSADASEIRRWRAGAPVASVAPAGMDGKLGRATEARRAGCPRSAHRDRCRARGEACPRACFAGPRHVPPRRRGSIRTAGAWWCPCCRGTE